MLDSEKEHNGMSPWTGSFGPSGGCSTPPQSHELNFVAFSQVVRVGHNKEVCRDGVVSQPEILEPTDYGIDSNGIKSDSFGPWIQVSYGRNGRNNLGVQYASKRSGNMGNVGKNIISDRKNSPHKHGVGNSGKLSSIETGINLSVKETMNVLPTDLKGRNNNTNMGGSRFAILSEELDEVVTVNRSQTRTGS
ncbi:hypothetical protein QYF36_014638 [Acer negundo]|nr:hypothetical protein QYF36_014638 [Acer negundo]